MRRWLIALAIALVIGIIGLALGLSPLGASLERNAGLRWLFHMRGTVAPPNDVVVVGIDSRTGSELGLPALPREWPRSIHARLIETLAERGAAVIAFDMHFGQTKDAVSDKALVDATARAGNVVLIERLSGKRQPITDAAGLNVGVVWIEQLLPPFAELAAAANGLATFPLPKEGASVDRFWVFKESTDGSPTLPAVALQLLARNEVAPLLDDVQRISPETAQSLPDLVRAFADAEGLRNLMRGLRDTFVTASARNIKERQPPDSSNIRGDALVAMYSGDPERPLNFYGPPGTIRTVSYQSVINGDDPNIDDQASLFKGKVVFVGYSDLYDPGQPDRFYTVFTGDDGVDLSGVEIAATSFANLLTDRTLAYPGPWTTLAILFLFGTVMGAILFLLPAYIGVPIALILSVGYAIGAQQAFNQNALVLPIATPLLAQATVAMFVGLVSQYLLERRRGQRISEAINYYLPDDIARDLAQNRLDPSKLNQVVYATCLATDMAGFSTIAEQLPPGELAEFLNEYFETLATPLKKHGVHVTEFRADAIMCAWTSDRPSPEPRRQALLAALDAAEAIEDFKDRHEMLRARLRIGLEVGHVFVGHAGGGGRFVYSIVGDSANTASRVEGLNKHLGTQILATGDVLEGFDDMLTRYLGDFVFVGKTDAIPIFEVVAKIDTVADSQAALCNSFEQALAAYRQADWSSAVERFEKIIDEHVDDGPSRFYVERCRQFVLDPESAGDPLVIHMTEK
ncbi:MAG: adenylate cyclase [Hyphomicrobiaceae bacterium]|jgi:adenylate cyclase